MVTISSIKARDIMQVKVVTLTRSTPVQSAIESLEELHIGGAPVVDENGDIVGMFSAADIAKAEHLKDDLLQTESGEYRMIGVDEDEDEPRELEEVFLSVSDFSPPTLGRTTVGEWMSRGIVSVGPECGLRTICRLMVNEHIHRVPVVEHGKLIGIISTLDIVRCIAGDAQPREVKTAAARPADSDRQPARRTAPARVSAANGVHRRSASHATRKTHR